MTWQDWRWDPTQFEGSAPFYRQGRLPSAPATGEALATELGLDGTGRLLDVGCGPGVVAALLAPHVGEVVGLDPDPGMLVEAERLGLANARWVQLRAEDLPAGLGAFHAITFGASFHWMDRPRVAATVATMLVPGGAAVQVDAGANTFPIPPAVDELRVRYLGPDRRAGQGVRNTSPGDEDAVFRGAGFSPMVELAVPDGRTIERTVDDAVANVLSSSATAPHLFGDRLEAFVADLRSVLAPHAPFRVTLGASSVRIWRRPASD